MRTALASLFALCVGALVACSLTGTPSAATLQSLPAGAFQLEKPHSSLLVRLKHMGLSNYTVRFTDFAATLDFNPQDPADSRVSAIVNPLSVRAEHPTDQEWDARIGADLLEGEDFPQIVFTSTAIETTGERTGRITGDLTLMGVTEPVILDVIYNGAAPGAVLYQGRDAVGFSARTTFSRSGFGLTRYASVVADEVEIILEVEFTRRR